jgi:hypothetical protein
MKFICRDRCDHMTVPTTHLDVIHRFVAAALACFTTFKMTYIWTTMDTPWSSVRSAIAALDCFTVSKQYIHVQNTVDMTQSLVWAEILLVQQKSLLDSCEGKYSHSLLSPFKEQEQNLWAIFYSESSNIVVSKLHKYEWSEREERKIFLFLRKCWLSLWSPS